MMVHKIGLIAMACATLLSAPLAHAQGSDDAFVIGANGQKFFALPTKSGAALPVGARKTADNASIGKGFIALNRSTLVTPRAITTPNAVTTVRGNQTDREILTLFDNQAAQPLAGGRIDHGWPLPIGAKQYISSGYGMRKDPFHGRPTFHGGVDIAASTGTAILATADGRVTKTGRNGGLGNSVTIRHSDGSESVYSHLQNISTRIGAQVRKGQQIATLGSTGRSTGPHLDYRLKQAGQKVNPMTALAGKQPLGMGVFASKARPSSRVSAQITGPRSTVRQQNGVRIITPQQRIAMSGGFIRVR